MHPEFSHETVRQELASILATPAFRNSPLRSRLLTYVVDCALTGDHENLKEYVIGVEVFGRPESFDPRLDSVVRVHATQLRKKLHAYYEVNGSTSRLLITVPPCSYKPVFQEANVDLGTDVVDLASEMGEVPNSPGLLVLPCADLDSGSRSPLSTGLTDELVMALSEQKHLRVVPGMHECSASVRALIRHVSRGRATAILDTSIKRAGERLRMNTKLLSAKTVHVVWTQRFEIGAGDEHRAQETLAHAAACAVGKQLSDHGVPNL